MQMLYVLNDSYLAGSSWDVLDLCERKEYAFFGGVLKVLADHGAADLCGHSVHDLCHHGVDISVSLGNAVAVNAAIEGAVLFEQVGVLCIPRCRPAQSGDVRQFIVQLFGRQ